MIPTMILVGLVIGLLPLPRAHRVVLSAVLAVVVSFVWGIVVDEVVEGTLLALANVAAGTLVMVGLRAAGHALFDRRTVDRTPR